MKRWMVGLGVVALLGLAVTRVVGQDGPSSADGVVDVRVERALERLERTVERFASQLERRVERIAGRVERAVDGEVVVEVDVRGLESLSGLGESLARIDQEARGAERRDRFEWSGRVDQGDVLEVKGVNGPVRAVPAEGDEVEVVALKRGRRSDPEAVRIEVVEHRGGVTLCAVYPARRGVRDNYCGVGEDGRNSVQRNDVRVDWEVRVPEGVRFTGRTVNGGVEVLDLSGDVRAVTVNGDVEVETSAAASAETVNGSIRARMGVLTADAVLETVNGSIDLDVADDVDAELDASWLNGSLDLDIDLASVDRVGRRSARGRFGDGGPLLRLETVNGSIRVY